MKTTVGTSELDHDDFPFVIVVYDKDDQEIDRIFVTGPGVVRLPEYPPDGRPYTVKTLPGVSVPRWSARTQLVVAVLIALVFGAVWGIATLTSSEPTQAEKDAEYLIVGCVNAVGMADYPRISNYEEQAIRACALSSSSDPAVLTAIRGSDLLPDGW